MKPYYQDSAVSPTIKSLEGVLNTPSAGEAPMSFGAWCKNKGEHDNNYRCLERDGANTVWSACHIGWNAREPEIAQMRDELIEAEIINKTLEDKLYSSVMEVTALKQELAQAKEKFGLMLEEREQMRERMKTLEHALYISEINATSARAAIEGKLVEMRKVLETMVNEMHKHLVRVMYWREIPERASEPEWLIIADLIQSTPSKLAALEPIKKEEKL